MPALISVGPVWSVLFTDNTTSIPWKKLEDVCSYFNQSAVFSEAFRAHRWDGKVRLYQNGKFPTGLFSLVRDVLLKEGVDFTSRMLFNWPERQYNWQLNPGIKVRSRHREAIEAVLKNKRGLLQLPTRFGKTTVVASGTIAAFGVPTLFIAHQKDLIYDAKSIFEHFILGGGEIGIIGNSLCSYRPITVACIDSLANKLSTETMQRYLKDKVKYVIVDETQYYGPGEYKRVLNMCNAPYRVLMSATPERNDGKDLELMAASGKMIYHLTEKAMIEEGYIADVNVEMIPFDHKLYNENSTGINYNSFYTDAIVYNVERNELIVSEVKNLLAGNNPSLIIVKRIEHGHILKQMLIDEGITKVEFIWGEIEAKERIRLRTKFNEGEFDVLIGSTVFDTAIDLHRASGLVLAASGSSKIRAPQRVGRVLSQVMGKLALVKDIKDLNVKYFAADAVDRQRIYAERYGNNRLMVRQVRELSELEKMFGINVSEMFENLH